MTPRRHRLAWLVALLASGACSAELVSSDIAPPAGNPVCITAACVAGANDGGADAVYEDVTRPSYDAAPQVQKQTALCGTGCGHDAAGVLLFPEDPGACEGDESDEVGAAGAGGAERRLGCGIVAADDDDRVGECTLRGRGVLGAPCIAQADCAPGFACVGNDAAGQCRPYCCADGESCPTGTFCASRSLVDRDEASMAPALEVPVCVEAHGCRLDEPYPCPTDQTCTCSSGLACTVVRADGTTGCVPAPVPAGLEGEPCPCSPATVTGPGLICSQVTQTCLALCILGADGASCGDGRRCQSSASLPEGFGICSSTLTADAGSP